MYFQGAFGDVTQVAGKRDTYQPKANSVLLYFTVRQLNFQAFVSFSRSVSCSKNLHIEVIFLQTQVNFSYFYGEESEQFSYFRIPRLLVRSKKFKTLSTEAKLLYGLMLDRMGLSAKHGWYDDLGRVYIYYTLDEIQADLICGHNKAVRLLAELDSGKCGFALIERVKQGQGRPAKIYVKKFTTMDIPETPSPAPIPDFPESEMQTSQNQTSRLPVFGSQDFLKEEASYLDNNYPNLSYPDPSIYPAKPQKTEWMERWDLKERVRTQIGYDALCTQHAAEDVDALSELIAEIQCSAAPTIRIGKEQIPIEIIKERFRQLTQMHVEYVLDCLKNTTTQINNMKAYLLTALYNAPMTMGFFYSAQVRHDFSRK